uniref:Uncharacterized protein n=1 Tax=Kwoniella dejecticola CBS 10117 TaxID=1296121 RepID=A0A1A6ABV4_9TREE|nr:uncharacterized protein I303_01725 [Kwoniella dejecticola CBS 10117]OBR87518.1 hypothetical protein I303_01725 [Kwoniella dejecticola CBS 10117]
MSIESEEKMTQWQDAPYLHFPNSTYLDSLSNDTDPYTIYYGQAAIVSTSQVIAYGVLNILGIILLLLLVGTILLSGNNLIPRWIRNRLPLPKNNIDARSGNGNKEAQSRRQMNATRRRTNGGFRIGTKIQRDPCLINAFIVIMLVNLLNLLYWLANHGRISSVEIIYLPHPKLCRAQAILQAGSQAAQMSVVLSVVLRLWLKTITLTTPCFDRFRGKATLLILLALPYLFVLGFVPRMIIPTPFYCSLLDLTIRKAYQILTGVIAIITLIMELWVIHLITKHFRQTSRTSNLANASISSAHGIRLNLTRPQRILKRSFYIRVSLFVFWTMGMIMATLYQAFDKTITDSNSDFVFASMGLIAFVCFASQSDILRAWNIPSTSEEWRHILKMPREEKQHGLPRHNQRDFKLSFRRQGGNEVPVPSGIPQSAVGVTPPELDLGDFLGDSSPGRNQDGDGQGDEERVQEIIIRNNTMTTTTAGSMTSGGATSSGQEVFSLTSYSRGDTSSGKEEHEFYEEKPPIESLGSGTGLGLGFNMNMNRSMDLDPPALGSRGMIVTLQEGMSVEEDLNLVISLNRDSQRGGNGNNARYDRYGNGHGNGRTDSEDIV